MSIAGTKSSLGDSYQDAIALYWLVEMLFGDTIAYVQADSTGLPDSASRVQVDDVVIKYIDGCQFSHRFIQAKKNTPNKGNWTIRTFSDELKKALKQIRSFPDSIITLYSQSPFGEIHRLHEACAQRPHLEALRADGEKSSLALLKTLASTLGCEEEEAFYLAQRLEVGEHHTTNGWRSVTMDRLHRNFADPNKALGVLEKELEALTNKEARRYSHTRQDLIEVLETKGCFIGPSISERDALEAFQLGGSSTSQWQRDIDGQRLERQETNTLIKDLREGKDVVVLGKPGCGKTCVLMDAVDSLGADANTAVLFIRGDEYEHCQDRASLEREGLPADLERVCARLAQSHQVVVAVDSLDVLSLSRNTGPLRTVLTLIDRLRRIDNLAVVASCRTFDFRYDSLLANTTWDATLTCQPLEEITVQQALSRAGLSDVPPSLLPLLQLPVHLERYIDLRRRGGVFLGHSGDALTAMWLETMLKNQAGDRQKIEAALRQFAQQLLSERKTSLSLRRINVNEAVIRRLQSAGLLYVNDKGQARLGHQTLVDTIHSQSLIAEERNLQQFCVDNQQHPFIRATLRTALSLLRHNDPVALRKQVRELVDSPETAFHIKRLVVTSLGEMSPDELGVSFVRWLFSTHPDLFRFFLWSLQAPVWFDWLRQHWEPLWSTSSEADKWQYELTGVSRRWLHVTPSTVLGYWTEVIHQSEQPERLVWEAERGLENGFHAWDTPGLRPFFECILHHAGEHTGGLVSTVAKWVAATNNGDDLLWQFMTQKVRG